MSVNTDLIAILPKLGKCNYQFTRASRRFPALGSPHTIELAYVFNTLTPENANQDDQKLARTILQYWIQFAKTHSKDQPWSVCAASAFFNPELPKISLTRPLQNATPCNSSPSKARYDPKIRHSKIAEPPQPCKVPSVQEFF